MSRDNLCESERTPVALTEEQAKTLSSLGQRLASNAEWWGDEEEERPSSVIDVSRDSGGVWSVLVREAVGVISVEGLTLVVSPKIPYQHFLYLVSQSGIVPRIDAQSTDIEHETSLWEVVAHWAVAATEQVLRGELAKGYREVTDDREFSRGRILPLETAHAFYQGRPVLACEFEEFSEDIALNRVLKAALDLVASRPELDQPVRRRARVALARMSEVGPSQHADLRVTVDRLSYRYRDALAFAKLVLRAGGTRIAHGDSQGWCFLIRTPELIESGIRAVLKRYLSPRWDVEKGRKPIFGTAMTLNPDLLFGGGIAVGDVKYKRLGTDWNRGDLYQSVAFAAAAMSRGMLNE